MPAMSHISRRPPGGAARTLPRSHTVPDLRDRDLGGKDSGVLSEDPSLVQSDGGTEDPPPAAGEAAPGEDPAATSSTAAAGGVKALKAKRTTLMQHYYPERGWGWVVVGCAVLVQVLCHGLHTAYGEVGLQMGREFGASTLATGEYPSLRCRTYTHGQIHVESPRPSRLGVLGILLSADIR